MGKRQPCYIRRAFYRESRTGAARPAIVGAGRAILSDVGLADAIAANAAASAILRASNAILGYVADAIAANVALTAVGWAGFAILPDIADAVSAVATGRTAVCIQRTGNACIQA